MILISYGITKSGSTLAFQLAKKILEDAGFQQRRLPQSVAKVNGKVNGKTNYVEPWNRGILEAVLGAVAPGEFIVIKTHGHIEPGLYGELRRGLYRDQIKVHVSFRDPREIALSLVDAGELARSKAYASFSEYHKVMDTKAAIAYQIKICREWASLKGALKLHYNDLAFDTLKTIRRMARHLGVKCDPESVRDFVVKETFTQFNKGVPDRWRELTSSENDEFLREYGSFIREFSPRPKWLHLIDRVLRR